MSHSPFLYLPSQRLVQLEGGQEVLKSLLTNTGQSLTEVSKTAYFFMLHIFYCLTVTHLLTHSFIHSLMSFTQVKKSLTENVQQMATNIKVVDGRIEEALAKHRGKG